MKVLISASAPKLESSLDPRFGRAAYFLVVDSDTLEWTALENPAVHASGGAGIQAAQLASNHACTAVISGDFGPNAFNALQAAGIEMVQHSSPGPITEILELYKTGKLKKVSAPGNAGHHGR